MTDETASVLIVEDERELADLYAAYVDDSYDVSVAYGGEAAIEMLSEEFDAMLLDRRMPVVSGNEVLAAMEDRDLECRVALVTAVNPDFDIIDLGIDDYLVKPVTKSELRDTVDRLVTIDAYNERVQELTSKKLKRNVLEVEKTRAELQDSDEFDRLNAEITRLQQEVERMADDLEAQDLERYL